MHKTISRFWGQLGDISIMNVSDSELYYLVASVTGKIITGSSNLIITGGSGSSNFMTIARELNGQIIEYYYQNKAFSEKDMLRIIKLKAFL